MSKGSHSGKKIGFCIKCLDQDRITIGWISKDGICDECKKVHPKFERTKRQEKKQ